MIPRWKRLFIILLNSSYACKHTGKIEIDVPEANEWVERIGKTAYEMLNNNRIKLKTETSQRTGLVIKSNDSAALSCIGWTIEKYLDDIPPKLRPIFQKF